MHPRTRQAWMALPIILLVGAAIAWAGSHGSRSTFGWPLFAACGALSFGVNWLVFIPAYLFQTERYFDLTGSLTYLTLAATGVALGNGSTRSLLLAGLISVWAARLGLFLFLRIRADGSDGRFDPLKPVFARFLLTWTLQGLWVFLTISCALVAMTTAADGAVQAGFRLGAVEWIGLVLWITGFALEVIADAQKRRFRKSPENDGQFITTGVWAWSRHPNYFGEITLWVGIALIALPALSGWTFATLISPLFVFILLTRISGIPLLAARAKKRWGNDPAYLAYLERTSTLVPRPPRA